MTASGRVNQRHPARLDNLTQFTLLVARGQAVHPTIAWLDAGNRLVPTIVIRPDVVHVPIADLPRPLPRSAGAGTAGPRCAENSCG